MTDKLISDLSALGAALGDNDQAEFQRSGQTASESGKMSDLKAYIQSWLTKSMVGLGNVSNALQLIAASNLSDLTDAGAARNNLGLIPPMDPDFSDSNVYLTTPFYGAAAAPGNMLVNTAYASLIWVPRTRAYSTYAINVTTGTASAAIRMALFSLGLSSGNLLVGSKLDEIATPIDASTTGLKTGAFGDGTLSLTPGPYWLLGVASLTVPVTRFNTTTNIGPAGTLMNASGCIGNSGKTGAFTYGAFPSPSTISFSSNASSGAAMPVMGIR